MRYTITVALNDGGCAEYEESSGRRAGIVARRLRHDYGTTAKSITVSRGVWDNDTEEILIYRRDNNGNGREWHRAAI